MVLVFFFKWLYNPSSSRDRYVSVLLCYCFYRLRSFQQVTLLYVIYAQLLVAGRICSYIFGLSVLSGRSSRLYFRIYLSILSVPWHLVSSKLLSSSFSCRYLLVAMCPNSLLCNNYTYVGPLRFIYSLRDQSITQCLRWTVSVKYPCLDVQVVFIYGNIFLEIYSALTVVATTVKYRWLTSLD